MLPQASLYQDTNVSLNRTHVGEEVQLEIDVSFHSALIYKNQNGESIELIQLHGVSTQSGRFTTLVMDHLYTTDELKSNCKDELIKDERYQIIEGSLIIAFTMLEYTLNIVLFRNCAIEISVER
ncbi:unnamed protein product [Rotaria magnacalcarata]|uniref:Uncharacterized protein n=1 Tax=Rotaria magnacalcarata TaxID=392030 RepID=A0A8S2R3R2_9BILA|nr:unnamed protein product [Rotaria magnacalcarata]